MKILEYFEKAWITAIVASFVVMLYNLVSLRTFDYHVYFPMFCGIFCTFLWYNVRRQRLFKEQLMKEEEEKRRLAEKRK